MVFNIKYLRRGLLRADKDSLGEKYLESFEFLEEGIWILFSKYREL